MVDKIGDSQILNLIVAAAEDSGDKGKEGNGVNNAARTKLGLEIIRLLMSVVNDELSVWLASLLNVSIEEFNNLPFDIEIEIIKQLQEAEEVTGFFIGAFQQFKGMFGSKLMSKIKKAK
jgi:hypothetical protein